MSEEPHMLVDVVEDNILVATFNRPEKLNAMGAPLMEILENAVHRFRDTPELKVMLIKSKGRYFSAGADLKAGGGGGPSFTQDRGSAVRESHRRLTMRRVWDEMEAIEKPFVVDSSQFERAFGVKATPIAEAIKATVAWYRAHPQSK